MTLTGEDYFINAHEYSDHIEPRRFDLFVSDHHQHIPGPSDDEPQMTIELDSRQGLGINVEVDFVRRLLTTEEFADMDPTHRNCLYKNERSLGYYPSYSQVHTTCLITLLN